MARAFDPGFGPGFGGPHSHGTLLLKIGTVGPDPAYQDGDIVIAQNRRRVRHIHADELCHPRLAERGAGARISLDSLARRMNDELYQYRNERIGPLTIARYNLFAGGDPDIITAPDIDVPAFVARRLAVGPTQQKIFGAEGAEVWYGGHMRLTNADLDRVWAKIEEHSAHRESNFGDRPLGPVEARTMLAVRVDDFDDDEAAALVSSVIDDTDPENIVRVRKRARKVNWKQLPGMSAQRIAQIEDRQQAVDIRAERKHPRGLYIALKT